MAPERDYSGVSTHELAALILRKVPEGRDEWATTNGIDKRQVRWILEQRYIFTGLGIADVICMALGVRMEDFLTIIPGATAKAAIRMATDELELFAEFEAAAPPTKVQIEARAQQLVALRQQTLGPSSAEQVERLRQDSERSKARLARNRNGGPTMAAA